MNTIGTEIRDFFSNQIGPMKELIVNCNTRTTTRHSDLAMRAAKRMSRARHKEKNGRIICQHLLRMLAEDSADSASVHAARKVSIEPLTEPTAKQAGKQYSLSF